MSISHITVRWSGRTLSEGSHCFRPARPPYRSQVAARGGGRWCLSASTVRWRTPPCRPTPRCHCFVLLSWNPVWWACDGLHKQKKKWGAEGMQLLSVRETIIMTTPFTHSPVWALLLWWQKLHNVTCPAVISCPIFCVSRVSKGKGQNDLQAGPTLGATTNIFARSRSLTSTCNAPQTCHSSSL